MRIIMAVIIAAGYGIIALSAPPTASADECPPGYYWSKSHATCVERPDNNLYAQYNSFLLRHGIDTSQDATRAKAERMADQICSSLDAGMQFDQLARILNSQIGDAHQESLFLVGAVDFQCPQHEAAMNAWLDSSS